MLGILGTLSARAVKHTLILLVAALVAVAGLASPAAAARDRTLYLYYTHTKETAKITFKRNGRYDTKGLAQLNSFLRDWRRDEPTKMDPRLFDLVWEVYNEVGASKPIHVVSAYRSPKTNEMLRSRSSAVAKNSNHTRGLAMDFFIPGVSISKLRQVAMQKQMGGVGYYPTSGSPFVHLDTGSVRAWPRMTTAQLKKIFPTGKTLHIPSNGVLLSKAGYATAQAEYKRCRQVPCNGATTQLASAARDNTKSSNGSGRTLLDVLFGNNKDSVEVAKRPAAVSVPVQVAALGQLPPRRPDSIAVSLSDIEPAPEFLEEDDEAEQADTLIPVTPPIKPQAIQVATAALLVDDQSPEEVPSRFAVASVNPEEVANPSRFLLNASDQTNILPQVAVRAGAQPDANAASALLAAYAPTPTSSPDAQKALEIILNRQNGAVELPLDTAAPITESLFPARIRDALATASLQADFSDFGSILNNVKTGNTASVASSKVADIAKRPGQFFEPESEDEFSFETDPIALEQSRFAIMFEPDIGDLTPTSVLGNQIQLGFASRSKPKAAPKAGFKTASTL